MAENSKEEEEKGKKKKKAGGPVAPVVDAFSAASSSSSVLDVPSEISQDDYDRLVKQIKSGNEGDGGFRWTIDACRREILEAARYDEVDLVRALLRCHPHLLLAHSGDDASKNTPLHMAAANGHVQTVELLLSAAASCSTSSSSSPCSTRSLIMAANASGNTPLHWAASNGKEDVVKILLAAGDRAAEGEEGGGKGGVQAAQGVGVDVLQRNSFGRSALTEGFQSDNTGVIQALLEHESATEERLLETSPSAATKVAAGGGNGGEEGGGGGEPSDEGGHDGVGEDSVTHELFIGRRPGEEEEEEEEVGNEPPGVAVKVREKAMAATENDTILAEGADRPQDDRTGLGVWASSIVAAQWMADAVAPRIADAADADAEEEEGQFSILELGAGCGLPSLVLAKKCSQPGTPSSPPLRNPRIYATDFNAETVENLRHNIDLNGLGGSKSAAEGGGGDTPTSGSSNNSGGGDEGCATITALLMNWKDRSTWPEHRIDYVVGSDLIYQSNMVPLLVSVVTGLLKRREHARFWYAAPDPDAGDGAEGGGTVTGAAGAGKRQGHRLLLERMEEVFEVRSMQKAPARYRQNPLESQDDELCFLHFHELQSTGFVLYEFAWKMGE